MWITFGQKLYNKNLSNLYFQVKSNKSVKIKVKQFRKQSSLPQLQRFRVYNIMLLAISLFKTSRQRPLSIKIIYKVHSCEKSNIIPFGYLS